MYETYGRIGPAGKNFWKRLFKYAKSIGKRDADGSFSTWICKKRMQIAAVVARNQAIMVRNRIEGLQMSHVMRGRGLAPYALRFNNVGPDEFSRRPR